MQTHVASANAQIAGKNQRILAVLETTTGMSHGDDSRRRRRSVVDAWQTYNDAYSAEPPIHQEDYSIYSCSYLPP
ncbi:MAG: hypothetical protein AAF961_09125, partial [Planctomycetota bacterium]